MLRGGVPILYQFLVLFPREQHRRVEDMFRRDSQIIPAQCHAGVLTHGYGVEFFCITGAHLLRLPVVFPGVDPKRCRVGDPDDIVPPVEVDEIVGDAGRVDRTPDLVASHDICIDMLVAGSLSEFFCPHERPGVRDIPVDERRGMPADCPYLPGSHPYGQDVFFFFFAEAIA